MLAGFDQTPALEASFSLIWSPGSTCTVSAGSVVWALTILGVKPGLAAMLTCHVLTGIACAGTCW